MLYGVLGPLEVRGREQEAVSVGPRQRRAVLAVLVASANRFVPQDRLIDAVWSGSAGPARVSSMQAHISRLRSLLGSETIAYQSRSYMLRTSPEAIDAAEFERLLAHGKRSIESGAVEPGRDELAKAVALWRGEAYEDFRYDDWAQAETRRLTEMRWDAVETRIDADLRLGRHRDVVPDLEHFVDSHPSRERLCAQLMLALYRCGRQRDALERYERYRSQLLDAAGLDPSPAVRELHGQILGQDPRLDGRVPPPRAHTATVDSSAAPERRRPVVAANLPGRLTSFVGRASELAIVAELVHDGRLVTITGPGGAGKTRLALEAAASQVGAHADGVWWTDLAGATNKDELLSAVWRALGFVPRPLSDATQELVDALVERELLLVLDNCEHLVDDVAVLVHRVVEACTGIHVLATSREPLAVPGERTWRIPFLLLPAPDELPKDSFGQFDALRLFEDRAVAVHPQFRVAASNVSTVVEICRRVDGLPLGIELAAAQLSHLGVQELLEGLAASRESLVSPYRTVPDRQRTLNATIQWSYSKLSDDARRTLDWLSTFEPPIRPEDLAAIDQLGFDGVSGARLALAQLADKSLVDRVPSSDDQTHYRVLESVRVVGIANLESALQRDEAEAAHARHFAGLANEAGQGANGGEGPWINVIEDSEQNIVRAIRWCEVHDPELGAEALCGIAWYHARRRYMPSEVRAVGRRLVATGALKRSTRALLVSCHTYIEALGRLSPQHVAPFRDVLADDAAPQEAKSLAAAGLHILGAYGYVDHAAAYLEAVKILQVSGSLNDRRRLASVRYLCEYVRGNFSDAREAVNAELEVCGLLGIVTLLPTLRGKVADIERVMGHHDSALENARIALAQAETVHDSVARSYVLGVTAEILLALSRPDAALAAAIEAVEESTKRNLLNEHARALFILAACCERVGATEVAHRLCAFAVRTRDAGGHGFVLENEYQVLLAEARAAGRLTPLPGESLAALIESVARLKSLVVADTQAPAR